MKDLNKIKREKRRKRAGRTRAKIFGTKEKPRLSVFRSNKHIYAQLINDDKGETMVSTSDLEVSGAGKGAKKDLATAVGQLIAKKAESLKIKAVVFDKGGYKYHGLIQSLAEGARAGGLKF
ncbi:MAG: 50S ribosomal protein L18 [Parcubacteria group bacterium LiPW_39]|nr:MAG: 50S ribosomal protein L18 [Parcubacteria group bacterium LiPW_39]